MIETMSIKDLRALISKAGLSYTDCIEKSDLIQRAKEAQLILDKQQNNSNTNASTPASTNTKKRYQKNFAGYDCVVIGDIDNEIHGIFIMLHGYGATNDDFIPIATMLPNPHPNKNILFIFPQAPSTTGFTAWWPLDVMEWISCAQGGEKAVANLIRKKPEGIDECRNRMLTMIQEIRSLTKDQDDIPMVIGGFSQGAMTAMDVALHLPANERIDGVVMISGAPIVVEEWAIKLKNKKNLKVFLSHGKSDAVLPFACSSWTKELLTNGGAQVKYVTHERGHELGDDNVLRSLSVFMNERFTK